MSIEQFKLILCDMYKMDVWIPPYFKWKTEFRKASYSIWAVDELERYVTDRLYPRKSGTVDELIKLTSEFVNKTRVYSKISPKTKVTFSIAQNIATDVLELLHAMK